MKLEELEKEIEELWKSGEINYGEARQLIALLERAKAKKRTEQ